MKGKKSDPQFISSYITNCIAAGSISPEEIVKRAREEIDAIDFEIRRVERLKIHRSKLLDVIGTFDKVKEDKTREAKILSFFDLKYPEICKKICDTLVKGPIDLQYLMGEDHATYNFCIKQLLMYKIVEQNDHLIVCGERYFDYRKFVLQED